MNNEIHTWDRGSDDGGNQVAFMVACAFDLSIIFFGNEAGAYPFSFLSSICY
jgi:hypothetical protein